MQDNIIVLNFDDSKIPEFKEVKGKQFVYFGEDNLYPDYLIKLFNKSAKHNAIINGKVNYIFGDGFYCKVKDAVTDRFIFQVNSSGESLNDIAKKCTIDIEIFGGFYLNIIPNKLGQIAEIYHLDFNRVRANEDGSQFFYKNDWSLMRDKPKEFAAFNPTKLDVASIFQYKEYRPGLRTYPLPNYVGAINYIESDIEVSKHTLTNAKTGFSATKLISFFNGEPAPEMQRDIQKRLEKKFTGSDGSKIIVSFNNDPTKKPIIDDLGSSDLTKEDFNRVDELITNNIMAGHQVTSPALFGITEPSKLGNSNNGLRVPYDIFCNVYAASKQRTLEKVFNYLAKFKGIKTELFIQPVDKLGFEFTDATVLAVAPRSWILEKMGIDPLKYPDAPAGGADKTAPTQMQDVNSVLTNLTGRQHQQISRIVRQFTQGKLSKDQAALMLKNGFGFSDDDVNNYLGTNDAKFSKELDEVDVAMMFSEVGERAEDFDVVFSREANFTSNEDMQAFETNFYSKDIFATSAAITGAEIEVLKLIQKDKNVTAKTVGEALSIDESYASKIMTDLLDKGMIATESVLQNGEMVVVRTLTKRTPSSVAIQKKLPEIMIKYSYEVKPGVGAAIIAGTRPFCKMMIEDRRYFTRVQIEAISSRLGYSLWDRRGGFWNKGNGKISASCRHIWKTNVVVKK